MRLLTPVLVLFLATGIGLRPTFSASYPSCNTPLKGWRQAKDGIPHLAIVVTIALGRNKALWWNKKAVSWSEFKKLLDASAKGGSNAFWVLEPNSVAECRDVNEVRREMEKTLTCSKGRCGEGRGIWERKDWH